MSVRKICRVILIKKTERCCYSLNYDEEQQRFREAFIHWKEKTINWIHDVGVNEPVGFVLTSFEWFGYTVKIQEESYVVVDVAYDDLGTALDVIIEKIVTLVHNLEFVLNTKK